MANRSNRIIKYYENIENTVQKLECRTGCFGSIGWTFYIDLPLGLYPYERRETFSRLFNKNLCQ